MTAAGPTQLPPEIAEALAGIEQARFAAFPHESLAWLALPPAWTEQLAHACRFPQRPELEAFLDAAVKAKLCSRDPESAAGEPAAETARTLAALWRHLQSKHRDEFRDRLVECALGMPDREEGLTLLLGAWVLDDKPEIDPERLRFHIENLADQDARSRVLIQAALHFPALGYLEEAWQATATASSPRKRAAARVRLLEIAARNGIKLHADVLEEVRSLPDPAVRAALMIKLYEIGMGGDSLLSEAAAAAGRIEDPPARALYLSLLARASHDNDYAAQALAVAASLPDTAARSRIVSTIAVNCGGRVCAEALNLAWTCAVNVLDSSERSALLALAASQLALVQPDAALARAQELHPVEIRAEAMLACLSSPANHNPAAADAIACVIDEIPLESMRIRLLLRLAAFAVPSSLRALDLANRLQDDVERRAALISLFPSLNVRERFSAAGEILNDLRCVGDPVAVRTALVQLAPHLDERQLGIALSIAAASTPDRGFRADEPARGEILEHLRKSVGALFLSDTAYAIGQAIQNAKSTAVPTATARWAKLASQFRDPNVTVIQRLAAGAGIAELPPASSASSYLARRVRELVDAGDTGSALSWLRSGQSLIPVAGGDLEAAVLTGRHRVELSYRRSMDERHLRRYLERAEQTAAFQNLLTGPDSHWALHYLGVGGVGKTMLLRHITARLAVKDGLRLATSRVDFDHISPEFPVRKPGQLLSELADELRIYGGSTSIEGKFGEFQDRLLSLHAELSVQPPPEDPLKNVKSEAFQEVVASFADLLRHLPPPVILILDTCEELSKLEPVGATLPSVEATFLILDKLHERIPSVRVLLAGRRLLAQSGDSTAGRPPRWRADKCEPGELNCFLPRHKPYLRLHAIRGFTREESARFLDEVADVHPGEAQRDAILDRSAEVSEPLPILWSEPPAEHSGPRFNPFDLALYAEWLRESPNVTEATIRSGKTEPYVEMRIVRRMENDLSRKALPAAVLLRRFDSEMLRAIIPDASERAEAFRDLQGHEWTDSQRDEDSGVWFLEVNSNLRKRIESYFSMPPRDQDLEGARLLLGLDLDRQARAQLERPQWFNALDFSHVEPALRLQAPEPAALLWDAIDRQITETAEWNWAFRVCQLLLGEGNAAGSAESPLRAAIRATLNSALLHLQSEFRRAAPWREVAQGATRHPIPEIGEWLAYRAATFVAQDIQALRALSLQRMKSPAWSRYRTQQAGAGLLARVYESGWRIEDPENWPDLGPSAAPELLALQQLALGRAPIHELDLTQPRQRWADWRIPDCLTDRVRLEIVLAVSTGDGARPYAIEWAVAAAGRLDNIDTERLLSALLAGGHLSDATSSLLERISDSTYYDPARTESCRAHSATLPLYYRLALEWKRRGEAGRARLMVNEVRSEMLENRRSDALRQVDELIGLISEEPAEPRQAPPVLSKPRLARSAPPRQGLPATSQSWETAPTSRPSQARPASSRRSVGWIGYVSLGLLVLGITIYAAYRFLPAETPGLPEPLFRSLNWAFASERHMQFTGIAVAIAACLILAPRCRDFVMRAVAMILKPRLVVSEAGDRVRIARVHAGTPRFPFNFLKYGALYEVEVRRPGSDPYREEARKLEELGARLRPLLRYLYGGRVPFELIVPAATSSAARETMPAPPNLQSMPWEALIHSGIAGPTGKLREYLQIARTEPGGNVDTDWTAGERIVLLARSSQMAALERAWSNRAGSGGYERIDERSAGLSVSGSATRALHLVGRTRRSGAERTFQIDAERHFTVGRILALAARIVIVQSQPVESLERTDTDREQIAALRAFAADLFQGGVHTVILLPQYPAVTSEAVAGKIAAFCTRGRRPGYFALLNHITDIRNTITKSITAGSASLTEASQKYTYAESAAPARSETVDRASLNAAAAEMSMDVTVWTRHD